VDGRQWGPLRTRLIEMKRRRMVWELRHQHPGTCSFVLLDFIYNTKIQRNIVKNFKSEITEHLPPIVGPYVTALVHHLSM
jgi:hypothetical protein